MKNQSQSFNINNTEIQTLTNETYTHCMSQWLSVLSDSVDKALSLEGEKFESQLQYQQ